MIFKATGKVTKEEKFSASVLRCNCNNGQSHVGQTCPTPRVINLGNVRGWPMRHPFFYIGQKLGITWPNIKGIFTFRSTRKWQME